MKKTIAFLMGTAALVASAGTAVASPITAHVGKLQHHQLKGVNRALTVLYDQHGTDSGIGIVSQNFESSFDQYDSQAADDFTIPMGGKGWIVEEVDVTGVYFNGSGPATSENVFFYKNKHNRPGKLLMKFLNVTGADSAGSFVIPLVKSKGLKPGTTWVSVQINMDFNNGGEWGWENQTTVVGNPAQWQNPGGGFESGANSINPGVGDCTTWTTETICIPDGQGDHMFALKGKTKGG